MIVSYKQKIIVASRQQDLNWQLYYNEISISDIILLFIEELVQ